MSAMQCNSRTADRFSPSVPLRMMSLKTRMREAITGICRKASLGDSHGSSGARTQLSIGLGSGSSMRPRKKASRLCSSVG
jgi:hypothetical protein